MTKLAYENMLLPGETLVYKVEGAHDISSSVSCTGTLYVTSFQLFFIDSLDTCTSSIPLGCISSIKKPKAQNSHNIPITDKLQHLELRGKDLRVVAYVLPLACKPVEVRRYLEATTEPESIQDTFAFFYSPNIEALDSGWLLYNPLEEFRRIGLIGNGWRVTEINKNFDLSRTYPEVLVVPETITDETLEKVAEYRSKGRIPSCVWKHKTNTATISRCSQPLVGLGRRSEDDEALFREIHKTNNGKNLFVVDARPKVNAAACNLSGGGTEIIGNYTESRATLEYSGIANIHVVRESLKRLGKMCEVLDNKTKWSDLASSHWFDHISSILAATRKIVSYIEDDKSSVVTHCTDGWDRTSQLCALSEMLLDPFYRTTKGFLVIICKEFLSFGHKFNTRNGNIANLPHSQRAPIFIQFLDCVWQLTRQFPTSFEFSEHLLLLIASHLHANLFGTFLCDCESERKEVTLRAESASLWGLILRAPPALAALLTNPMYMPSDQVLRVNPNVQGMQLWRAYHQRWAKKAPEPKGKDKGKASLPVENHSNVKRVDPTLLHVTGLVPFLDILPRADQEQIRKELIAWLSQGGGKERESVRITPLHSPARYSMIHPDGLKLQHSSTSPGQKNKKPKENMEQWEGDEEEEPGMAKGKSFSTVEKRGSGGSNGKGRDSEEGDSKGKVGSNSKLGLSRSASGNSPTTPVHNPANKK